MIVEQTQTTQAVQQNPSDHTPMPMSEPAEIARQKVYTKPTSSPYERKERRKALLKETAAKLVIAVTELAEYKTLQSQWSDDEVAAYIRKTKPPAEQEKIFQQFQMSTLGGVTAKYHALSELKYLSQVVGVEDVRKLIKENTSDLFTTKTLQLARQSATKAEHNLLQKIFVQFGFRLSLPAILMARPAFWNGVSQDTALCVQEINLGSRGNDLGLKQNTDSSFPSIITALDEQQMLIAVNIFRMSGDTFAIEPFDAIDRLGWNSRKQRTPVVKAYPFREDSN